MPDQQAVPSNDINNGQWAQNNAFDSKPSNAVTYVVIDADQDYLITSRQAELLFDRRFIDRSAPRTLSGSNSITQFFGISSRKTRASKTGYLTSASLDKFRQGIELKDLKQWSAGFYKILAGTPGHIVNPVCFGTNEDNNNTGNNFFQELNLFNPIEFIGAQGADKLVEQVITFPIVTADANQKENYILNGIIEPFPIRPIISYFSIYFPVEPQGIKANFSNSDPLQKKQSDLVENMHEFLPNHRNNEPFLDAVDALTMTNDTGTSRVEVGPSLPYFMTDTNYLSPFKDAVNARGDTLESTRGYDSDMLSAIKKLPKLGSTYLRQNEFSGATGFTYNDSVQGVDSIAFGGLTR